MLQGCARLSMPIAGAIVLLQSRSIQAGNAMGSVVRFRASKILDEPQLFDKQRDWIDQLSSAVASLERIGRAQPGLWPEEMIESIGALQEALRAMDFASETAVDDMNRLLGEILALRAEIDRWRCRSRH